MAKKYKTTKETQSVRNVRSIDLKNLTPKQNRELIKKAEKGNLPGYHVVNPVKGDKYLRSNPDTRKKNNLDPKIGSRGKKK